MSAASPAPEGAPAAQGGAGATGQPGGGTAAGPSAAGAGGPGGGPAPEVITFGEAMALMLADDGLPLRRARQFRRTLAGAELNTAVGLARLGHRASYAGRVGDDPFGEEVRATLLAEAVEASGLIADPAAPTGMLTRDRDGHRRIRVVYHRAGAAGSRLAPGDLAALPLAGARLLHVTGITPALSDSARAATLAAVRAARAAGVTVSFDPNHRAKLWSRETAAPVLRELAALSQIVLTSEEEGAWLAGLDRGADGAGRGANGADRGADDAGGGTRGAAGRGADGTDRGADGTLAAIADFFHAAGARIVVIKRGADGARVSEAGGGGVDVPALAVGAVVDPVGAGDAFDAGFLSGWLDGLPPAQAAHRGAACGAAVVQVAGDLEGLPTRAELDDLMAETTEVDR